MAATNPAIRGRYCSLQLMTLKLYYDRYFNEVPCKSCFPLNTMFPASWFLGAFA